MSYPPPPPGAEPASPRDHPRAVASLVLGILSVMLCSLIGPFAWRMGRRTLVEIDTTGGQYGGRGMAQAGYILGIVGTVLLAVLLLVVLVMLIGGGFAAD